MWRIITFALWTGCRRQEILNLKWQNVSENTCRIIGKGQKERVVYLLQDALKVMDPMRHIGPVFKKMYKDTVSHKFKALADACNIKALFHNLRHTHDKKRHPSRDNTKDPWPLRYPDNADIRPGL
jgi:integrase/recombinase XerD